MPEAIVIIVDNSDWARNEDYYPNRKEAQADAASTYIEAIGNRNPENIFAGISMGGGEKFSKVLSSLTLKTEQITSALYKVEPSGRIDVMNALKISSLILKNREQKHFHQRIVLFVGSPIKDKFTVDEYKAMGGQLKKAGISLDVISTGEISENYEKLHALFDGATKNDNESHFLTLAAGSGSLTDVLLCSPLLNPTESGSAGAGSAAAGPAGAGAGVVEDELTRALRESRAESEAFMDEELQRAMLASLEDFNARGAQNQASSEPKKEEEENSQSSVPQPPQPAGSSQNPAPGLGDDDMMDIDDEELRLAIQMSMMETESGPSADAPDAPAEKEEKPKKDEEKEGEKKKDDGGMILDDIDPTDLIDDPDFVNSVLSSFDGVDPEKAKEHLSDKKDGDDKEKK